MRFLFDSDTWQEIFSGIKKNKTRTGITIIGVMWGIFLLVVLLGAAKGIENKFNSLFGDFATNSVFIWSGQTSMPFKGFQEGRPVRLKLGDVEKIKNEIKGIDLIAPRSQGAGFVVRKFQSGNFSVSGDFPVLNKIQNKNMLSGRFINVKDIKEKRKVCVIEEEIYKQLFEKNEEAIGELISINGINYKVVGIFKESETIRLGDNIHVPFTTFQQVYNRADNISWMIVTGNDSSDIEQIEKDAKLILKNLHNVHPKDKRAFGGMNLGQMFQKVTEFLLGMQFLTWFVGIATLIAGVFAIGNILLITVKERTNEIGIRRALGAKPWEIKRQIMLEAVFLTSFAGVLGIILGGGALMLIDTFIAQGPEAPLKNPTVDIPVILIAAVTLVVLGTLIGLIPAHTAVSIKPIDALREE
ncbi:MAG: multidrug ABC transporter ATP-binding protein [Flavobacteriaceae bacterium]|nr:MAG: multidrug ABC transporter ATP-binding protein [Flavobacteriaceae bacterium]